jgi:hypothetical protein
MALFLGPGALSAEAQGIINCCAAVFSLDMDWAP